MSHPYWGGFRRMALWWILTHRRGLASFRRRPVIQLYFSACYWTWTWWTPSHAADCSLKATFIVDIPVTFYSSLMIHGLILLHTKQGPEETLTYVKRVGLAFLLFNWYLLWIKPKHFFFYSVITSVSLYLTDLLMLI